jgi:hypothetical protein
MLSCILDTIIPAEPIEGLPSAAAIGFTAYCNKYSVLQLSESFTKMVGMVTQQERGQDFCELDEDMRLHMLNLCRTRDIRLFSSFITHVFRAYYSNRNVLERIGSGAVPPFPQGNLMASDDWTILEPVFNRGAIYRAVE